MRFDCPAEISEMINRLLIRSMMSAKGAYLIPFHYPDGFGKSHGLETRHRHSRQAGRSGPNGPSVLRLAYRVWRFYPKIWSSGWMAHHPTGSF
jgi:hypothetical protein